MENYGGAQGAPLAAYPTGEAGNQLVGLQRR